jgi:hypothetical protein
MRTELNAALAGEFAIGTDITISRLDLARCNNALAKKVMLRARLGLRSISSRAIYAGQRTGSRIFGGRETCDYFLTDNFVSLSGRRRQP